MKNKKYISFLAAILFCGSACVGTIQTSTQSSVLPSFQSMSAILGITTGVGALTGLYVNAYLANRTSSSPRQLKTDRAIWGGGFGLGFGCAVIGSLMIKNTLFGKASA